MQKVKLGDILVLQPKSKIKAGEGKKAGEFPFFTSSKIQDKFINIAIYSQPSLIFGTGGEASVHFYNGSFATSTDCLVFNLESNQEINLKYVFYYLCENIDLIESGFHGCGLKHISKTYILDITIFLPNIEQQNKLVKIFDNFHQIENKRKEQIKKLDLLIKSRFLEMFGDVDLNYKNSQWRKIGDFGEVVGGSTPKTDKNEFWGGSFLWITPAEMDENSFIIKKTERTITEEGVKHCSLRILPKGTVLLTSRAPIGKVGIAGVEMYCNQGFKNIICGAKLQPVYMYFLLKYNVNYLNSLGRGATFKEISKTIVENILIPIPSIELQNQFAEFVENVDKLKKSVRTHLEKLETLKKSLMQQYFG